jgi:hypothetical protein
MDASGERIALPAVQWLQRLPARPANWGPPEPAAVRLKIASGTHAIARHGELLGWIDRLGPVRRGILSLDDDHLRFRTQDGSTLQWPLDEITAIQPSSSSLQIKARGRPVASLGFPQASVRLWEDAIQDFIRRRWRAAGRGEIVEFQPMIRTW